MKHRRARLDAAAAVFGGTLLAALASQAPPPPPAASIQVRVEAERVNAVIRGVPAQTVLEEFAARSGVIFEVAAAWNPTISVVLEGVPLGEAIERCVATGDAIFYFGVDAAGARRLKVVRVFPRGSKGQPASLRVLGTGTVTRSGADEKIESAEQALKVLAESPRADLRVKAVEVLGAVKTPAAAATLAPALDDKFPEVRAAAIEALAGMGNAQALARILAALKDENPGVRQSAVEAVALLGTGRNVKDLRPLLRDPDPGVVAAVDVAVRRLGGRR